MPTTYKISKCVSSGLLLTISMTDLQAESHGRHTSIKGIESIVKTSKGTGVDRIPCPRSTAFPARKLPQVSGWLNSVMS